MGYKWIDIQELAIELSETYPEIDPLLINFVDLRDKIIALECFEDDKNRCGEKILESIQMAWIEENRD